MEQYIPLVDNEGSSSAHADQPDFADVDLEKIPEQSLPRWYQLPRWKMSSKWEMAPKWSSWSKEDIPDAKTCLFLVLSYAVAALPRFMQPGGLKNKNELHPTAYLDALRGWAALFVFRYHMYANKTWLLEQPVFRAILNGRGMVDIFFVISGYVLSYRLLKMIRNQQHGLQKALASSTFRRWFRLYVSTGIASLVTAFATYLGWCLHFLRQPTFYAQMMDWVWDFLSSSNPFGDIRGWWYGAVFRTKYLDQMWTIPVEFRGSLVVFWFCAAAAFLSTRGRRIFAWVVIALCYLWGCIYASLFLLGMLIADVSFDRHPERLQRIRLPQQQDNETLADQPPKQSISAKIGYVCLAIVALFLIGQPSDGQGYSGPFPWQYLSKAIPWYYPGELGEHFWLSIGSSLLVFALDSCRMLQIPFEWGFSQYLGDISFGIYAMHNTVNWCLYIPIVEPWRAAHLGDGYFSGLPGILFTTLVVLWTADYFTRIDDWVVWFGKWLETRTFIKWAE